MALVRLAECAVLPAPSRDNCKDYSLTEVSFVLNDLSWTSADDSKHIDKLENEVMVDAWSSMESTNSPLTDSGPSASDDCTPSTSSGLRDQIVSPLSPEARCNLPDSTTNSARTSGLSRGIDTTRVTDKARSRDLTLDLQTLDNLPTSSRRHFLDDDYQSPTKLNIECRIPKPHFLDHSPSPDEFDERSDITNPNFLDDDVIEDVTKSGVLSKKPVKGHTTNLTTPEDRPHRSNYRIALHYGLESAARSSERDKRASQLYQRTWPGEKEAWIGHDTASVRSFSSNGSTEVPRPSSNLENKMECVYSLLSLLTLSPDNNADLSGSLLEMSRSVDSCIAMRQAGCIPLLVQLIHSKLSRETCDRAAKALRNIIHTQTDDKSGRREARVWRLLEQVREYCYILEDLVESRKDGKEGLEDDATKHPSQCVAALMKLSFDEEHRHVVCHLGGLQALAGLVSGDQAAHGSQTHDATCLTMRRYAGMTLTNLTFGDGNNKTLLCSFKDFMMALVEQLESPNDDMRQVTAAVLRNLSWRADANSKQILREVGAVKGLTKAAMTCQKEATLKSVLSALWNLTAHCSMNKVALCSVDGALGFLVDMLSYNSPTKTLAIVENAGGIMRNVSSHIAVREDYRQILRERNCLSVLLQHLKSPSLTVVSNSCGTLWNLSARCPHDQQFLWDHGAVPMLRSLIHSKHKMIAMGSSAALKNLLNSKPGKSHIVSLDSTARNMNLPALPTLGARKQKALEQELDQNLAETCDNIEPATSPSSSHRDEKNLFTATERQIAMNLERHRMTSSSPLVGVLASQISLSHSANLPGYHSCSNTLLKGSAISRSATEEVNRSDSKDSVASAQSDSAFERATRIGKVPVPTPRNKDFVKIDPPTEAFKVPSQPKTDKFKSDQPPVPTPRTNYTESGFDVDQDSCDQPIDYSRKYSESKPLESPIAAEVDNKEGSSDYQETDLDQPTDYSLRYAEHQTEAPSVDEDTIKHFCTEGTPYETPVVFSTATSMSDLRVIGNNKEVKKRVNVKEEKEPSTERRVLVKEKRGGFETKMGSGLGSPEKPVQYCEEGTPGYFSRVSSLSSLGEPAPAGASEYATNQTKDKDGSKAVTFARFPEAAQTGPNADQTDPNADQTDPNADQTDPNADQTDPNAEFVQDTPLMFSRTSSLDSIPECDGQDEDISVESEHSRMTSCCISPSELPDSPPRAPSAPLSPPPAAATHHITPPPEMGTVFEERLSAFVVENTPAHFSTATSLSELTIPDDKSLHEQLIESSDVLDDQADIVGEHLPDYSPDHLEQSDDLIDEIVSVSADIAETPKEADTCHVYITEDTPALSDISASSDRLQIRNRACSPDHNTSKSFPTYEGVYHSLPPYLRSSTETVRMSQDVSRHAPDKGSPPPPLPPKSCHTVPPPRPPTYLPGKKHESRLPVKAQRFSKSLTRNDSLSSLSLDSFGSTDREIFEQTVKAGVDNVKPRRVAIDTDTKPHARQHKSLDRSDRITQHKHRSRDMDKGKHRKSAITRSPHSFPGDLSNSLANRSDSLSSLSNDSFGSTDKEVFERCVRLGMSHPKKTDDERIRSKQDDKRRKREPARPVPGALDKMQGHKYSRDRAILEEVIAKGAGEKHNSKNVPAPFAVRASVDGNADNAPSNTQTIGCEHNPQTLVDNHNSQTSECKEILQITECQINSQTAELLERPNELPTVHSPNTTVDSFEDTHMDHSNECLAPLSANTTLRSDVTDHLDRSSDHLDNSNDQMNHSNESYADVLDGSLSDSDSPPENQTGTLKRLQKPHQWTDLKVEPLELDEISSKKTHDTWNDNTCPDDVTFPTMSGSTHMVASIRSEIAEIGIALPDLLEKSGKAASAGPDLTDKLDDEYLHLVSNASINNDLGTSANFNLLIDSIPEPSFTSLLEDSESKFTSLMSTAIQKEATRLAAQLKSSQFAMENSVTSVNSLDLENVKPPSDPLGSLLSLSASGNFDDTQTGKKSRRKKSLPVSSMVRRALSNSINQSSSEHLDANPVSFLENVKPPSELEMLDMESSMRSVCSIDSEVVEPRDQAPVVFDLKQPIQEFPLCNNFVFQDLETVNPPSLFDEIGESTVELEQTTAQNVFEDCISNTLNIVTDIPSGSETCTPIPSDVSSVESTPKRNCLTPKQRRQATKDRYQTYTITDSVSDDTQIVLEVDSEEFLTWTKSESDSRSDDYLTAASEPKIKRKLSAKQRRQEDRARYQTQTVDIGNILSAQTGPDPQIENLKQCLTRKSIKQKRAEDADRYKTRTLSEEASPSPIARDHVENAETTTGYGSLSSNEPGPSTGDRTGETDSGHNDDDFELNSVQMRTYTQSFRNYLPVVESPAAVDLCIKNNLKNMRLSAHQDPSTSDFASLEGDDGCHSDSDLETRVVKSKPKIIKPEERREESLDSNESLDTDSVKGIRGRKKASYVSPYRRNVTAAKSASPSNKPAPLTSKSAKSISPPKPATKPVIYAKSKSSNTSPKRTLPVKSPAKSVTKPIVVPLSGAKPLPLERQGTFTKETADKKAPAKTTKTAKTSPSRLPQPNSSRFVNKPPLKKTVSTEKPQAKRPARPSSSIKTSASNHSLQSDDSGKTVTLAKSSRQGSTTSVNGVGTKAKEVESKIASLWRKVEQSKKVPTQPDRRIWIEPPRLVRSSTFDRPKVTETAATDKIKSQIPSLRPKTIPSRSTPATGKVFARRHLNGQTS